MKRLNLKLQDDDVPLPLIMLIQSLSEACKEISFQIKHGALAAVLGSSSSKNVQGETQKKLDIIANQILVDVLKDSTQVNAIASEELEDIIVCNQEGEYLVSFDPLDGSTNTDVNGSLGTIFSISKTTNIPDKFLRAGRSIVSAGYVLYGPSTMLVLSTGGGTNIFTLDSTYGSFLLTHSNVVIPEDTSEFSFNMSNQLRWSSQIQQYILDLLLGTEGIRKRNFNMRWAGSMVGDMHRILCRGGIFGYPSQPNFQEGKLRLLYEANPMAYLVEQAGGEASNGVESILDIVPTEIHQRTPIFIGSKSETQRINKYLRNEVRA